MMMNAMKKYQCDSSVRRKSRRIRSRGRGGGGGGEDEEDERVSV